jgi:UrcA family protein
MSPLLAMLSGVRTMRRTILYATAIVLSVAAAAPAAAQTHARRISYADLNLSSPEGARAFDARIRNEARQACGERMGRETLREYLQIRACKRAFIESVAARGAST